MLLPAQLHPTLLEAGADEAGRGPLAGPVVAAAVILPKDYTHPTLTDSKQLTEEQRLRLREDIVRDALAWNVGIASVQVIDRVNILQASLLAMQEALAGLTILPEAVVVDGNKGFAWHCSITPVVKGDSKLLNIAAASILAKTYRDELMARLHQDYPQYNWAQNKGYPTAAHRAAIAAHGLSPWHRKSFRLLPQQLLF